MNNVALFLLGGLLIAGLAWVFAQWYATRRLARGRQHLEDTLKHLFDLEYRGQRGTLASITGALKLPDRVVLALMARMQAQGLITARDREFDLTPQGERLALQVVRAHRLLERYFADEAQLPLTAVHAAAERGEHRLSPEDADRLSAALGHPAVDPHGDPIPTRDGFVPPASGTPATAWPIDQLGRVVHLEDEPPISYAQLVAEGIRVGQTMRLIESTPERLIFTDGINEYQLAPAVAANIFLAAALEETELSGLIPLADLDTGSTAEVVRLDDACQGYSRRRLMDLGFTEGAHITPALSTFAGDPRAYRVRGTLIALRRSQSSQVHVRPL